MNKKSFDQRYEQHIKIAYIHVRKYPSQEANALQAIKTASAFSEIADTTFFVPRLTTSKSQLKKYYNISESPLRIQSLFLNLMPDRFLLRFRSFYEQLISLYLRFHPQWAGFEGRKVLFVRDPKELIFWGQLKKRRVWLKDWTFIYEAHDALGIHKDQLEGRNRFELHDGHEGRYNQIVLQALHNFDLVVCVTQALSDDIKAWTNNAIQPYVVRHASLLSRVSRPPQINNFGEKIVLGYIGTIDKYRGVNMLLEGIRFLPHNYHLRIVGKFHQEAGVDPNWLNKAMEDPQLKARVETVPPIPIHEVAKEIDRCDIVVQPASKDIIDSKYASPLKSYDYKVRGKPILVADVPCHHELYQEGVNGVFYSLDPQNFAKSVKRLVENPTLAKRIAHGAWEQSADFNLHRRAENILSLVKNVSKRVLK